MVDIKTQKEMTAGLIVYRPEKEGPKFLIMYHRGSYWNFPKGHIESGEESLEAAIRETCEETGLKEGDLRVRKDFKVYERFRLKGKGGKIEKTVILYLAETRKKQIVVSEEHEGYGWFLYRDARKLFQNYKESQTLLKKAYDAIQRRHRHQKNSSEKPVSQRPGGHA